jgi:hypothetical protein
MTQTVGRQFNPIRARLDKKPSGADYRRAQHGRGRYVATATAAARDSLPSRQPGCPDERIGRALAEHDPRRRRPVLVTGAHRSGTTWVGRMLDLSPGVGYINEPFNPHHAPGICACRFPLWFQYVNRENEHLFRPHLSATLAFRYHPITRLVQTRRPADAERLLRAASKQAGRSMAAGGRA